MTEYVVELRGISKAYGPIVANRNVTLRVRPAEVHALVGENGAGKSTLMRILYGLTHADAGEIWVKGERVAEPSPARAIALGIGMVHQHFMLVPALRVVENVVLGREPTRAGRLDLARAAAELGALSQQFGLEVDPFRRVEDLSVGQAQRVEILKLLWRGADILVLDEPTAVLTPPEVRDFFRIVRALVAGGKTALLITHKLDEVMALAQRVTVLRRGETVAELEIAHARAEEIARAMVGRDIATPRRAGAATPGEVLLEVRDLVVGSAVRGLSFEVRGGEIFGIAGVEGNGQTELVLAIAGLLKPDGGQVRTAPPAHIPEDRHRRGLVLDFPVEDNLILGRHHEIWGAAVRPYAERALREYDVRPADPNAPARSLSGGNQQKIVVARELERRARVIVAAQPTRGVDVGAAALIHERLLRARADGCAVILVSAEIAELQALADRIAVLYKGRLVKTLDGAAATEEELGLLMTGAREAAAP